MDLSLAYKRLAAKVGQVSLSAIATTQSLAAVTSARLLSASVVLGEFFKTLRRFDVAYATDLALRFFQKTLSDSARAGDYAQKQVGRSVSDAAAAGDTSTRNLNRPVSDGATAGDAVNFRSVIKALSDVARATDDFNGAASADDDQVIAFTKVMPEQAIARDVLARVAEYTRAYSDSAAASEVAAKHIVKSFFDEVLASDEAIAAKITTVPVEEGSSIADQIALAIIRSVNESLAASDALSRVFEKYHADGVTAAESHSKALAKTQQDAASTQDFGSVRSQNYCSFDYFMEDYVGKSSTF